MGCVEGNKSAEAENFNEPDHFDVSADLSETGRRKLKRPPVPIPTANTPKNGGGRTALK